MNITDNFYEHFWGYITETMLRLRMAGNEINDKTQIHTNYIIIT